MVDTHIIAIGKGVQNIQSDVYIVDGINVIFNLNYKLDANQ